MKTIEEFLIEKKKLEDLITLELNRIISEFELKNVDIKIDVDNFNFFGDNPKQRFRAKINITL